jgi:hypothetical protein
MINKGTTRCKFPNRILAVVQYVTLSVHEDLRFPYLKMKMSLMESSWHSTYLVGSLDCFLWRRISCDVTSNTPSQKIILNFYPFTKTSVSLTLKWKWVLWSHHGIPHILLARWIVFFDAVSAVTLRRIRHRTKSFWILPLKGCRRNGRSTF